MTTTATTGTKPKLLTADDLLQLDSEGVKGELIMGVLHKRVSNGVEHGEIVLNLGSPLHQFVKSSRLGRVVGSDVGILLGRDPDTVREPDIAFISAERMPLDVREKRYSQVVPDLVVEVVSPNDRPDSTVRQGADVAAPRRAAGVGHQPGDAHDYGLAPVRPGPNLH